MEASDSNQGLSKSQKRKAKKKQQEIGAVASDSAASSNAEVVVEEEEVKHVEGGQGDGIGRETVSES